MKKIIRLTESDLTRIVKRVLKEQPLGIEHPDTFFKGWTKEEVDYYNRIPKKDRDEYYYKYTSQEVLDSVRTRMETAETESQDKEKRRQGFVQLGDEVGYESKPKTENAGQKGDPNWYTKFPCIDIHLTRDYTIDGEDTPARALFYRRGISILYFYDGSALSVTPTEEGKMATIRFWYCKGEEMEYYNTSMYNVWVPKTDPRSQAQKYYDDYLTGPKFLKR